MRMSDMIGKEVQIYPGDTYRKWGRIVDIKDYGVLFQITKSEAPDYEVGSYRFISFSAKLSFQCK